MCVEVTFVTGRMDNRSYLKTHPATRNGALADLRKWKVTLSRLWYHPPTARLMLASSFIRVFLYFLLLSCLLSLFISSLLFCYDKF